MNADKAKQGAPADDTAVVDATASVTPIRQEEQGQQSQQEVAYPAVDCGSCWYHEDAVKTGGK